MCLLLSVIIIVISHIVIISYKLKVRENGRKESKDVDN